MIELLMIGLSILAGIGWFFCIGHVIASRLLVVKPVPLWMSFSFSLACIAISGTILSPWFPIIGSVSIMMGLIFLATWLILRPPLPVFSFSLKKPLFFGLTIGLLIVYTVYFLLKPDRFYDSLAYHLGFIHEFAQYGKVLIPSDPLNWTDYVHGVFPRGVEMILGLGEQFFPGISSFLHLLILVGTVWGLMGLARVWNLRNPWGVGGLYLLLTTTIVFGKMFYVELTLFLWGLTILYLLWNHDYSIRSRKNEYGWIIGLSLMACAMSMSKINALAYVGAFVLVAWWFHKSEIKLGWVIGAGVLATGTFIATMIVQGVDFFHVFSLTQATIGTEPTPVLTRVFLLGDSLIRLTASLTHVAFLACLFLVWKDKASRPLTLTIIAAICAFGLAFSISNLYHYTYQSFGIYSMAFVGLSTIALVRFIEFLYDRVGTRTKWFVQWIVWVVVIASLIFIFALAKGGLNGNTFDTAVFYPEMVKVIPNEEGTVILFLNNINPITYGFENAIILDHTSFEIMQGDPCLFVKEHSVTHIVYWAKGLKPLQLDHGNPEFYEDMLTELTHEKQCTVELFQSSNRYGPIFSRVNLQN